MRPKRLLLIDAVKLAEVYPDGDQLRNVERWFLAALKDGPAIQLKTVSIEGDLDAALELGVDGIIISGSPRDAWGEDPAGLSLLKTLKRCENDEIPVLGVCYGHQILARYLGGQVARHPQGLQLYTAAVTLSEQGRSCPLFEGLNLNFQAISGHADYVQALPEACTLLATSQSTQVQAFNYRDLFFGVQFHPEFTAEIIQYLWRHRIESWRSEVPFDLEHRVSELTDAPGSERILHNFVDHIIP
ncbi:MAG: gamma-glutamyl-gamma-aminobutyrate hydrolase family protein [Verrucomicrobiota bacterium]